MLLRVGLGNAHAGILFFLTAIMFIIINPPRKRCRMYVTLRMARALHGYDARHVRPTVPLNTKPTCFVYSSQCPSPWIRKSPLPLATVLMDGEGEGMHGIVKSFCQLEYVLCVEGAQIEFSIHITCCTFFPERNQWCFLIVCEFVCMLYT